jgi:uncharacterized protein (DUF111 family)
MCGTGFAIRGPGCLDLTPIVMKKGPPGPEISLLTTAAKLASLQKLLFTETTTLGIRDTEVKGRP